MLSRGFALPFLCLASAMTNAEAFVSPAKFAAAKIDSSLNLFDDLGKAGKVGKTAFKVKKAADLLGKDKDGNVIRVPVKDIERDWIFDGFKAEGDFSVDLFLPEDQEIKGCAFFMHGFSQYPVAYYGMLKDACEAAGVAIIAVETGLTSEGVLSESFKSKLTGSNPQYVLQRAVSEDTKQCIRMLEEGDEAFAEYGVTKKAVGENIAVMGHSMGGGLSFPVAADCGIDYVFVMAPAFGEPQFDPIKEGVDLRTPKESMLLAGGWDLIARAGKVKEISATANSKTKDSSVFVSVARGLHTGFQDEIVLFNIKLKTVLDGVSFLDKFFGILDATFLNVLKAISFVRTKTGQIDGSSILMSYFLSAMTEGKNITPDDAEKYLDDNLRDKFEDKFEFSYGGSE